MGAGFKNGRFQLKQLSGGKMDDITVLVAFVDVADKPSPPPPPPPALVEAAADGNGITAPAAEGPQ